MSGIYIGYIRKIGCNQGNDICPGEKRTDTFHLDACTIQVDGMALGCRYGANGINQIPQNLTRPEIKVV